MPELVTPQVFMLGETKIVENGLQQFLNFLKVPDWTTDAATDAEKLIEVAGKTCYMSFSTDLNKNLTKVGTRNNQDYIQKGLIGTKHGSVLEHCTVTFALCNVSRVFTHELVRHRPGTAFSQVSGRYVRTDVIALWLPKVIRENKVATEIFLDAFAYMEKAIKKLEELFKINEMTDPKMFSWKKVLTSAFRRLIGNGQANHIIFTANHRTFRHIIEVRTDPSAEEEIRLVAGMMWAQLKERFPAIYHDTYILNNEGKIHFEYSKV